MLNQHISQLLLDYLEGLRSPNTRRAYQHDITRFMAFTYPALTPDEAMEVFLHTSTEMLASLAYSFRNFLVQSGRSEAVVNRSLSALHGFVTHTYRCGLRENLFSENIPGERISSYRDTRGITLAQARMLLQQPDTSTTSGRRDLCLLLLLLENGLRRAEITALNISDLNVSASSLRIHSKGKGTQLQPVTLSPRLLDALIIMLQDRPGIDWPTSPLFVNYSNATRGQRLTADGLYKLVRLYAERSGLHSVLSPHRLRHTAITLALDATGGDVRAVQRLSRHARLETLMVYDDNRRDLQGEVTRSLSEALQGRRSY